MFEEDRAPVTLIEIDQQADSCQRTAELARERSRVFDLFHRNECCRMFERKAIRAAALNSNK